LTVLYNIFLENKKRARQRFQKNLSESTTVPLYAAGRCSGDGSSFPPFG
jgi:hypothetical protein